MADGDVLRALEPYIQAGNSGTVMFVFGDNSLGRIYLESGVPVSARYRNSEGMAALDEIRGMDIQTVKFHDGTDIVRSMERLEANAQVEQHLNQPSASDAPTETRPAAQRRPRQARAPAPTGPLLSPASRQILQQLLSDYIGPVAPLVMGDLPGEVDIETALAIVSREIDDPQRATEFIITARQSIG